MIWFVPSWLAHRFRGHAPAPPPIYVGDETVLFFSPDSFALYLDAGDDSLTPRVLQFGAWEHGIARYLRATLRPGDTFVDVGANNGILSLLAGTLVGAQGLAVAFEPQAKLCALIERSARASFTDHRLHVEHLAIGAAEGTATLGKFARFSGAASLTANEGYHEHETVALRTLDAALADIAARRGRDVRPRVVKIDVEGYEHHVWQGMQATIARDPAMEIILEFSGASYANMGVAPAAFLAEFTAAGFRIFEIHKRGPARAITADRLRAVAAGDIQANLLLRR